MSQNNSGLLLFVIMKVLHLFWFVFGQILTAGLFFQRIFDLTKRVKWSKPERIDSGDYPETNSVRLSFDGHGNALAISDQLDCVLVRRFTPTAGWGKAEAIDKMDTTDEVESSTRGTKHDPCINYDTHGNALAAWQEDMGYDSTTGFMYETWTNHYTHGNGWGKAERFEHTPGEKNSVKILGDAQGYIMAVWCHNTEGRSQILCKRYAPDNGWGQTTQIAQHDRMTFNLKITGDRQGRYLVIWDAGINQNDSGDYLDYLDHGRVPVYGCYYSESSGWSEATQIVDDVKYDALREFEIVFDRNGNVIIVWSHFVEASPNRRDIRALRYDNISGWGKAGAIEPGVSSGSENESESVRPKLALDHDGNTIVVWKQDRDRNHGGIWTNRYTVGTGWGDAVPITIGEFQQTEPQIAIAPSGNAMVVWSQKDGIGASYYTPDEGWGAPENIHQGNHSYGGYNQSIAIDANGKAITVWLDEASIIATLRTKFYTPGKGWGSATPIYRGFSINSPKLVLDPHGIAHIIWEQRGKESSNTYFWSSHLILSPDK